MPKGEKMLEIEITALKEKIKLLEKQNKSLKKLAYFDPLTNTYNRTWFNKNITQKSKPYLIIVDLNNLKNINDSKGHLEGDKYILKTVSVLKQYGKVVRYGGDEFIVLCKDKAHFEKLISLNSCDFSKGGVLPEEYSTIGNAILLADKRLYIDKKQTQNKNRNFTKY